MAWVGTILPFQKDSSKGSSRQETVIAGIEAGAVREAADLVITRSAAERPQLLDFIVRPYNFFKYETAIRWRRLRRTTIDPDGVIGHAVTALTTISPGKPLLDTIKLSRAP